MTTTQILDKIAPYTAADSRCGRMKKRKVEYRYQLLLEIEEMQKVMTNEEILEKLLIVKWDDNSGTAITVA